MGYTDPDSIMNVATGSVPPASLFDTYRTDFEWLARNKPHCRVYNSASISVANATVTALTFNSERVDVGGMHSTSSNTSRITIPTGGDGWYTIGGCIEFAAVNTTGVRQGLIRLNGATYLVSVPLGAFNIAFGPALHTQYQLAAGDYVELCAYQTSGGASTVSAAPNYSPEFYATWECI